MQASNLRFSAARLFYFLTLCAAATSLFGWLGVPVGCFVMLIWIQILAGARREQAAASEQAVHVQQPCADQTCPTHPVPSRGGVSTLELVVVLLIVAMVVGLMLPASHDFDPQSQAETSMKTVAKAIDAYQQHFGALPPTRVVGEDGAPLHSWRVLILPYMGEEKLAAAYRWDEPWNGPNNARLAEYRPWHYRTYYPLSESLRTTTTLQLLPNTAGRSYVVEHEQTECNWLEPTQLQDWQPFDTVPAEDQGFWQHGFFSSLYRGRLAVASDHSLRFHPRQNGRTDISELTSKPNVGGAQLQQPAWLDVGQPYRRLHLDNALRLGFFLLVALYPLCWLTRK